MDFQCTEIRVGSVVVQGTQPVSSRDVAQVQVPANLRFFFTIPAKVWGLYFIVSLWQLYIFFSSKSPIQNSLWIQAQYHTFPRARPLWGAIASMELSYTYAKTQLLLPFPFCTQINRILLLLWDWIIHLSASLAAREIWRSIHHAYSWPLCPSCEERYWMSGVVPVKSIK